MNHPSRRQFLKTTVQGAGALALTHLFPSLTLARQNGILRASEPMFFIQIRVEGSMDCTLGLDPKFHDPKGPTDNLDVFLEYRREDIIYAGSKGKLALGPSAAPLKDYADYCAVINGVSMRNDIGHSSLNHYMASGSISRNAPSLAVELASTKGAGPFGILHNNGLYDRGTRSVIQSSTDDIDPSYRTLTRDEFFDKIKASQVCRGAISNCINSIVLSQNAIKDFPQTYSKVRSLSPSNAMREAPVIAAAFLSGLANQAELRLSNQLDTHDAHIGEHLRLQKEIWDKVAGLLNLLAQVQIGGKSLLSRTLVMVMTEFSRGPYLNGPQNSRSSGKDHNPYTNSVLLAGLNVNGGQSYGLSKMISRKNPRGVGFHTGAVYDFDANMPILKRPQTIVETKPGKDKGHKKKNYTSVFLPEHVGATVRAAFGNPTGFASVPQGARPIPGVLKA